MQMDEGRTGSGFGRQGNGFRHRKGPLTGQALRDEQE